MTSRTAARLVRLYPLRWRARYGHEFAALLEQHPYSVRTIRNVLWAAGEAHMQAAISCERNQGNIVSSVWSAWLMAVVAGLVLYGMVDDSPLLVEMEKSSIFAGGWKVIQAGCVLAVSAIMIAALPLASAIVLHAWRERRNGVYLRLAIPFVSAIALVAWMTAVLVVTNGHWAASPWAVAFSRPDWPSNPVRWITGSISAALLVLGCVASATSVSQVLRGNQLPDLRIALPGIKLQMKPLSFATALSPLVAAGVVVMLSGVVIGGSMTSRVPAVVLHSVSGPLGLSASASWILSAIILCFAAAISARAAWRTRAPFF